MLNKEKPPPNCMIKFDTPFTKRVTHTEIDRDLIPKQTWWEKTFQGQRLGHEDWSNIHAHYNVNCANVLDIVYWKIIANDQCVALKMRGDRIGNTVSYRDHRLFKDWPGNNDWPGMFDRLEIEHIRDDGDDNEDDEDVQDQKKRNFRRSKACYAGVTYILKHKSSILSAKFQCQVFFADVSKTQRR